MYRRVYGRLRAFETVCEGGLGADHSGASLGAEDGAGFGGASGWGEWVEVSGWHMYRNQNLCGISSVSLHQIG